MTSVVTRVTPVRKTGASWVAGCCGAVPALKSTLEAIVAARKGANIFRCVSVMTNFIITKPVLLGILNNKTGVLEFSPVL